MLLAILVHQRKTLALTLVKQRQNPAGVFISVVIIVICLLTEKSLQI